MRGFDYLPGVVSLELDQDTCIGCGICTKVCPHMILEMQGSKAAIIDRDACMECGACALNCPVNAIKVDAGVGCASGMINRWLAGFNIRLRNDDSCC
ncbi:MAG: 4Fe-4S binding protein [Verrucomicrobia bacterium]|nr:4Fe-4S binding protein [Deltaproteobacteria bacterium]